jgi:hypothetical protein
MFMAHVHVKFHMNSSIGLVRVVTAIRAEVQDLRMIAILLLYILQQNPFQLKE